MDETQSPCIKVCKLNNEVCQACGRHLRDIAGWSSYTDAEKRAANSQARQRKSQFEEQSHAKHYSG